ncbi:MAG: HdeD family acid-resistance protein [Thiothrix sp.]|nr:HdeD family acid-resistance protein [Thiothrix sp.]HPQ96978.1 HdeD family acid-resistance protein [Thiolinea sp.]
MQGASTLNTGQIQPLSTLVREIKADWYWFLILGIIMVIGGLLALFKPMIASLTVELITGWTFIITGLLQGVQAFRAGPGSSRIWVILSCLISILLGVFLLKNPLVGLVSLTLAVALLIGISGAAKIYYAFKIRPLSGWGWVLVSGIISLILAVLILANSFSAALVTLGVLLGIELLSSGITLVMTGVALKRL